MTINPTKKLGKIIGSLQRDQQGISGNLTPEDVNAQLQLRQDDYMELVGSGTFTAKYYASDSFILDHPVYGELDSATLQLDGGYDTVGAIAYSAGSFSYPGTYSSTTVTLHTVTF